MKSFFVILLLTFAFNAAAADTVRIYDPTNLSVTGFTNKSFGLNSTEPSGDATSDTAPARVYLPIKSGNANIDYSILSLSGVTSLFDVTSSSHFLTFPLSLTVGPTPKYLYTAVRIITSGTTYYVINKSSSSYSDLSNAQHSENLKPLDICKAVDGNGGTACNTSLLPTSTSEISSPFKPMVYFFLSDEALAIDGGVAIDPTATSYSGGVYVETQMTNKVYDSTEMQVNINQVRVGDSRVMIDFSATATMDSTFKKVAIFNRAASSASYDKLSLLGAGTIFNQETSTSQSGTFTLNGLTNSTPYVLSVAFEDYFLFVTTLSPTHDATPLEIQELLKKQACFLLTAGFGEEHFVINYFRKYRDQILASTWLGRELIRLYYKEAPRYALEIYKSEWMRSFIRVTAYILYFLFNYYWIVLMALVTCYYLNLRKIKFLKSNIKL